MSSRKPLFSSNRKPIYGKNRKPVYADGVIADPGWYGDDDEDPETPPVYLPPGDHDDDPSTPPVEWTDPDDDPATPPVPSAPGEITSLGAITIVVSWSDFPDLDICVGFTGTTGVGWDVVPGTSAEMSALEWVSADNTTYGPEVVSVKVKPMMHVGCGFNVPASGYASYDVLIRADWFTPGATGGSCKITALYGSMSDTVIINDLGNCYPDQATSLVATLRFAPQANTLAFV